MVLCRIGAADEFRRRAGVHALVPFVGDASRNGARQVEARHAGDVLCFFDELRWIAAGGGEHAAHHAARPKMPHQGARVDVADDGDLALREE